MLQGPEGVTPLPAMIAKALEPDEVVVPLPGVGRHDSAERTGVSIGRVVNDPKLLAKMFQTIVDKSGLTKTEICKRLDIRENGFRDYFTGKRDRVSMWWFIRLCDVCGAEVNVSFPRDRIELSRKGPVK